MPLLFLANVLPGVPALDVVVVLFVMVVLALFCSCVGNQTHEHCYECDECDEKDEAMNDRSSWYGGNLRLRTRTPAADENFFSAKK